MITQDWRSKLFLVLAWAQFFILIGVATYLSLTPSPGDSFDYIWDKLLHFICWSALLISLRLPWLMRPKFVWAAVGLFAYSIGIEFLQQLSPPRELSVLDMVANGSGIIAAYIFCRLTNPLYRYLVSQQLGLNKRR